MLPVLNLISYAQNGEDVVLWRAFKDEPAGFYVDLGSGHPTRGSVTKLLHDKLGWAGLDIEALPSLAMELEEERTRSKVLNVAVSGGGDRGPKVFYEFPDDWAVSTLKQEIAEAQASRGRSVVERQIPLMSINDILQDHDVHKSFELLKVDIEGSDLDVLRSLDFESWTPKVILAETLCPVKKEWRGREFLDLLESKGYRETLFDGINSFFVHRDGEYLADKLSICANALDYYINLRWWMRLPPEIRASYPDLSRSHRDPR